MTGVGSISPRWKRFAADAGHLSILDDLHRESLMTLIQRYRLPALAEHEIDHLVSIWHRLIRHGRMPIDGLYRLKRNYIIGTLSNGNIGLMVRMARHAGLPWDAILGAEVARAYKPQRQVYVSTAVALNLDPRECMLVAAHNDDLLAASEIGYRTAFVVRPTEYGPKQTTDLAADRAWDIVTDSFHGVADALGCPRY